MRVKEAGLMDSPATVTEGGGAAHGDAVSRFGADLEAA